MNLSKVESSSANTVLSVVGLSYSYQQKNVLNDINLSLKAGGFYALLGPNGAGKSTLFSLICRLLSSAQGNITIMGKSLAKSSHTAMQSVGIVFQQSTLDLDLSVTQNLLYHASLHGIKPSVARRTITAELTRLKLLDRRNDKVRALNGGHRRRVEIARALLHQPALLLLDEASVGLDLATRQSINIYIRQLCADKGITVLSSTHQIDEVTPDDHLLMMHQGQICVDKPCQQALLDSGSNDITSLYEKITGGLVS